MVYRGFLSGLVMAGVCLVGLVWVTAALAAPAVLDDAPPQDSACRSCHEERYWLYDTGKWYCLCGKQGDCAVCHGGDETVWDEKLAHAGIVDNPIRDNPAVCASCHPDEAGARIEEFAAAAGIDLLASPQATQTPYALAQAGPVGPAPAVLQAQTPEAWRIGGLGLMGLVLLGSVLFGCRCWQADCLAKRSG